MKFVMTQAVCFEGLAMLEGVANIYIADDQDPNHYLGQMQDADALIVRIAKCDGHTIENSPNLKVIGRTGVGFDTIDVAKATKLGIPVVITPGANNRSVAEHALAMMFALSKNLFEGQVELAKGNWNIRGASKTFELEHKKIGILGLGSIGREVMKLCRACGMEIAGYDPYLSRGDIEAMGAEYYENYRELLKVCDVVSLHVPLTKETRDMIGAAELSTMKSTALLINCSRGGIINELALCDALRNSVIAGAGTDVFCHEPPRTDDPLLYTPNLIVSPHSAAQTREAVIKMAQMCVQGCLAVCNGEKWPYVADKKVYDHPKWTGAKEALGNKQGPCSGLL